MYDCLIIGGGVIGLSLAYDLAVHGCRVQVIDRATPGREASWAGAGILPPANEQSALHPLDQLRGMSYRLHAEWARSLHAETGIDTGYRRCGGIYVALSPGEAASLHGLCGLLREEGVVVERLSPDGLAALEPALCPPADSRRAATAYLLPDEVQIRNPRHLQALLAACQRRGVTVSIDTGAREWQTERGRVTGVVTDRGALSADSYCVAAGPWAQGLLAQLGVATGILPIRGQMVLFRSERPLLTHIVNVGPRYLVPRDDGRLLVGSTEEEVGFDKCTTEEAIGELVTLAQQVVPALRDANVEQTWAGLRPGTFDSLPYLGRVPGFENIFVAAGHFRSGLLLSTGTAVVMSRLIRGEDPQLDLTPFRVARG